MLNILEPSHRNCNIFLPMCTHYMHKKKKLGLEGDMIPESTPLHRGTLVHVCVFKLGKQFFTRNLSTVVIIINVQLNCF